LVFALLAAFSSSTYAPLCVVIGPCERGKSTARSALKRAVDRADLIVLVLAHRCCWIPGKAEDSDGFSSIEGRATAYR
jgi:hypothetical protein